MTYLVPPGFSILQFESLPSTNDYALERIRKGEAEAAEVYVARAQPGARGRMGRRWTAEPGGLWFTVALPLHGPSVGWGGMLAALAVCCALDGEGLRAGVKWPNDVVTEGRKLAGVLVETVAGSGLSAVGVGLNVCNPLPTDDSCADLAGGDAGRNPGATVAAHPSPLPTPTAAVWPPTSVFLETGRELEPQGLLPPILAYFAELWPIWEAGRLAVLQEAWSSRDACRGRRVQLLPSGPTGIADGIEVTGALRVLLPSGQVQPAFAGELAFVE